MSMSLYLVLALKTMPTTDEINLSAKELNIPIVVSHVDDLSKHSGFLPIQVSGNDSGVETYILSASEAKEIIPNKGALDLNNSITVKFRWGGNFKEASAAFYTAQTLTLKYNGVVFEPESGMFLEPQQLAEGAEAFSSM